MCLMKLCIKITALYFSCTDISASPMFELDVTIVCSVAVHWFIVEIANDYTFVLPIY